VLTRTKSRLPVLRLLTILALSNLLLSGCALRKAAVKSITGNFDHAMDAYTSDGDPLLVRDAMPATLKMIEVLLTGSPDNRNLLTAAASGFTMYSHAFVMQPADTVELHDISQARDMRDRGKQLLLRARDYGLRGLEATYPGFTVGLHRNADSTLHQTTTADISLMFWTAAAWGSAIGVNTDDYNLVLDLPVVGHLIHRCLQLDESWGNGQLHEFMISWEAGRAGMGGSLDSAEYHFQQALELNHGESASTYVSAAESITIKTQNRDRFIKLLKKAIAIDPDTHPNMRLANVLAQQRAHWLLNHIDHYFL